MISNLSMIDIWGWISCCEAAFCIVSFLAASLDFIQQVTVQLLKLWQHKCLQIMPNVPWQENHLKLRTTGLKFGKRRPGRRYVLHCLGDSQSTRSTRLSGISRLVVIPEMTLPEQGKENKEDTNISEEKLSANMLWCEQRHRRKTKSQLSEEPSCKKFGGQQDKCSKELKRRSLRNLGVKGD